MQRDPGGFPQRNRSVRHLPVIEIATLAVVSVVLAAAPPVQASRSGPVAVRVPAPSFARLPGSWRQFTDAPGLLTRRGANASAVALSWAYHPNIHGWAPLMPRDGIAVGVFLIRRETGSATGLNLCRSTPHLGICRSTPHLGAYPLVGRLPLRLPSTTTATLEGAPRIPEYRVFGRVGESYNFEVRVDVNNPHPSAGLRRTAQRVVSSIDFPRWPNKEHC